MTAGLRMENGGNSARKTKKEENSRRNKKTMDFLQSEDDYHHWLDTNGVIETGASGSSGDGQDLI